MNHPSLHCIICFEEFDKRKRPPVVLPCGHTYICEPCSARINRCHECREPLFWTPPLPKQLPASGISPIRAVPHRGQQRTATPATPKRRTEESVPLPLPRNLVLLDMMEAAETKPQSLFVLDESMDVSIDWSTGGRNEHDSDKEGDEDTQEIGAGLVSGIEAVAGPCGTYAVKDENGLVILPFDPRRRDRHEEGNHELEVLPPLNQEPFKIGRGTMVQVCDVHEGIYQLPRGAGFIVAGEKQLVKVGGPKERSCRMEGMKNILLSRKDDLTQQLEELMRRREQLDQNIRGFNRRINKARKSKPDHPLIVENDESEEEEKFKIIKEERGMKTPSSPRSIFASPSRDLTRDPQHVSSIATLSPTRTDITASSSFEVEVQHSPQVDLEPRTSPRSNPLVERNPPGSAARPQFVIDRYEPAQRNPIGCGPSLFCQAREGFGSFDSVLDSPTISAQYERVSHPSVISPSPTIDFSTGMSGHRGLRSSRRRSQVPTRQVRTFGHTGLGGSGRSTRANNSTSRLGRASPPPMSAVFIGGGRYVAGGSSAFVSKATTA